MEKDAAFERRFQQARARHQLVLFQAGIPSRHRIWARRQWSRLSVRGGTSCLLPLLQSVAAPDVRRPRPSTVSCSACSGPGPRAQVHVEEPSVEDTMVILRGIAERYASFHGVRISDRALVAAAELSARYIQARPEYRHR